MREEMSNIPKLPEAGFFESARRYVEGTWLDGAHTIHEGDKSRIVRVWEEPTSVPGIPHATFRLDAQLWHIPDEKNHRNKIRFEYTDADRKHCLAAEMHLNELAPDAFWLQHRYVHPGYRGRRGLGSDLFRKTEEWLQRVALARGHDVRIGLTAGQVDVFRWLQKQKFWILREQKPLLDEILQHPEHFVIENANDDPNLTQELYVFKKGAMNRSAKESIRLRFEKRVASGAPSPESDEVMGHFVPSWDEPKAERRMEREPMTVRDARASDAGDIARIHYDSWIATYANEKLGITPEDLDEYLGGRVGRERIWRGVLADADPNPRIRVFVGSEGGRVVGFSRVRRGDHAGHIELLYLDPAYTARGLGGELLREGIQWLGTDRPIELEVASYNERAIRFYERFGFRMVGPAMSLPLRGRKKIPMSQMVRAEVE